MNYPQTLEYLFTHLPMYQRIGQAAYKKDLSNIIALCNALNNPQQKFSCIHVAGTNGKGSVSNMLCSVLMQADMATGLYTSPHLIDFRERIRVNGKLCEEEFVIDFTERIKPLIKEIEPSFFEITVAMAFDYFAHKEIDIAVIETGLGGRLDSTNIITPLLSIITNISFDHQNMLGNTIAEIAFEKAGIIKKNSLSRTSLGIPVVIGEYHPESFPVFVEKAKQENAPFYLADENVFVEMIHQHFEKMELNISYLNKLLYPNLEIDLTGNYQLKNIKPVIQAIEILRENDFEISDDAVYEGLKNVKLNTGFSGRWQMISREPLIICDSAHNAAGLHELFQQVRGLTFNNLRIVTGMVNDKDAEGNIKEFPQQAIYYFCKPNIPRGRDAVELKEMFNKYNLKGEAFNSVEEALQKAKHDAQTGDLILICGSMFVIAEAILVFSN